MNKRWLVALLIFISGILEAQSSKWNVGVEAGTSWYMGDINPDRVFYAPSMAGGFFLAYNLNKRFVIRTDFDYYTLKRSNSNSSLYYPATPIPPFLDKVYPFYTGMINVDSRFEFNFEPFAMVDRKKYFTPYVNAGIGYSYALSTPKGSFLNFPFGVGMKMSFSRKVAVGCEWNPVKTFSDKLDGITNPGSLKSPFQNNDWYTFFGIYIIYRIFDAPNDCPAYQD